MTKHVFSISGVGKCSRTQSAELLNLYDRNANLPAFVQRAAREGSRHERWIREDLPELGFTSLLKDNPPHCTPCDREGFHIELETDHHIYRGHFDDLVTHIASGVLMLAEYKALGRFICQMIWSRDGITSHRTYHTQVSLYDAAYSSTDSMLWVVKNRDTGELKHTILGPDDFLDIKEIDERQAAILQYAANGELAPCDVMKGGSDTYGCIYLCEEGGTLPKDLTEDASTAILQAVRDMRSAKIMEAIAKPMKEEANGVLKAWMMIGNRHKITVDGMDITLIKEGTRNSFNVPDEIKDEYRTTSKRNAYIRTKDGKVEDTND